MSGIQYGVNSGALTCPGGWDKTIYSVSTPGYWGYYLPDQDHGPEYSEFADFFATYKATLPIIGRLMNISQAMIIPLFPVYDEKNIY